MSFTKKVLVAVGMDEDMAEALAPLGQMDFLKTAEVEFVHVFQTTNFAYGFGEYALVYPLEGEKQKIQESVEKTLRHLGKDILPEKSVKAVCLFSDDPKDTFVRYSQGSGADLIIIAARRKRGLFESSFAQFAVKHSATTTLILKHPKEK